MEGSHTVKWVAAVVSAALLFPSAALAGAPGLVAGYNFDEATGTSVVDASGNGNTGTLAGPTRSAAGHAGGALSFDGVNDQVNIPDAGSLDLTTGMTLEAWINPSASGTWRSILLKERPAGLAYALYATDVNAPMGVVFTSNEFETRGPSFPNNAWTHLATTYDGSTLRQYINGAQVSSRSVTGPMIVTSGALRIGGNAIWDEFFAGRIDDVRVYNRALTAAEVLADRNTPVSGSDTEAPSAPGGLTATISDVKNIDLDWTAASDDRGVTGYRVYRSDSAGFTPSAATLRTTVATPGWRDTLNAPGTYYYKVIADDAAGNAGPAAEASAVSPADTTPPTVSLTNPVEGQSVSRITPISVGRSDDWGVVSTKLQVDGGTPISLPPSPLPSDWDTTSVPDGNHTLVALATDAAGNVGTSAPVTVNVSNAVRSVTVTAPTEGSTINGTVTVKADVANAPFPVSRVVFTIGSGQFGSPLGYDDQAPYEVELDTTMWGVNGPHWVTASVYDASSEYPWVSPKVNFTINNVVGTPGDLTADVAGDDVHLAWSAPTGGNTPVAFYSVYRGTTPNFTPTTELARVTTLSYDDLNRPPGTYYYKVSARAASGMSNGPATATAVVADTAAPTVSVNGACSGATVGGTVALAATASDNVGVASVQFKLDGADLGPALTSAPYNHNWVTTGSADGPHVITAVARDAAGNTTASAACPFTVSNPAAPPSLIAAYGFEEASGSTATDSTGNNHTGAISGATRATAGKFGRALTYDGINDLVYVPHTAAFNVGSGLTLEAWVRPTVVSGWRTALMKQRNNESLYVLYATSGGGQPNWQVMTNNNFETSGPANLAVNAWTHLATTYDGSSMRLYVNGTLAASRAISGSVPTTANGPLTIGGNHLWPEWFKGQIDEVRVYSRALSASEVVADRDRAVQ